MTGYRLDVPGVPGGYGLSKGGLIVPDGPASGLSQIVHSDNQNNGSSASNTLTFTVPGNLQNDDVAVLMTFKSDDLNPTFPGESFTQLVSQSGTAGDPDRGVSIAYKVITDAATEISGSPWTFTTASNKQHCGFLYVVRGVNTSTPIDTQGLGNTSSGLNPITSQVLTTTGANRLGLWFSGGAVISGGPFQLTKQPSELVNFEQTVAAEAGNICFGGAAAGLIPSATTTAIGAWSPTFGSATYVTMVGAVALILA